MPGSQVLSSVSKALRALEFVSTSPRGLRLSDIADGLKASRQATLHIVRTLVHEGFLERTEEPRLYRLPARMSSIQQPKTTWNQRVLSRAVPMAIRLSRTLEAGTYVGQYVAGAVMARFVAFPEPDKGTLRPYTWGIAPFGSALAYVAFMHPDARNDYLDRHSLADRMDKEYWGSREQLLEVLTLVREAGYCAILKDHVFRVGVPVFDDSDSPAAILAAVKCSASSLGPGEMGQAVRLVREAAHQLSMSLQYT